jgi:hypothetical protein
VRADGVGDPAGRPRRAHGVSLGCARLDRGQRFDPRVLVRVGIGRCDCEAMGRMKACPVVPGDRARLRSNFESPVATGLRGSLPETTALSRKARHTIHLAQNIQAPQDGVKSVCRMEAAHEVEAPCSGAGRRRPDTKRVARAAEDDRQPMASSRPRIADKGVAAPPRRRGRPADRVERLPRSSTFLDSVQLLPARALPRVRTIDERPASLNFDAVPIREMRARSSGIAATRV